MTFDPNSPFKFRAFRYDRRETYEDNWFRWDLSERLQREMNAQVQMSEEESRSAFDSIWGHKKGDKND